MVSKNDTAHRVTLRDDCLLSLSKCEQLPSTTTGCIVIQCNDPFVYVNKTLQVAHVDIQLQKVATEIYLDEGFNV